VNIKTGNQSNTKINIALVQLKAQSNVAGGENQGRQLRHINIVRDFKTTDATGKQTSLILTLPPGILKKDCSVIAFLQDKSTLRIIDAASTTIE